MKRNRSILIALLIVMLISLSACQAATPTTPVESATKPTVDRAGYTINVPAEINSIITLAPSITQVVTDLGLKDKIIATDTQSPLYTEGLGDLKQFDMLAPDLEALASLKPDVMLVSGLSSSATDDPFKQLKDLGIQVVTLPTSNTIADIKLDNQFIADVLGASEAGKALNDSFQAKLDEMKAIADTITNKKTVLFEISNLPDIYTTGKGTYLHEMIELIGAKNIMEDKESWLKVTEEEILARNPDVILTNVNWIDDAVADALARTGWGEVTAIQDKQVFYVDNGFSSLPNHNIVKALVQMAKAVYPEQFKDMK